MIAAIIWYENKISTHEQKYCNTKIVQVL